MGLAGEPDLAAALGISLHDWENMTPVELNLYARAYGSRRKAEQKLQQANIYSLAALIRSMVWSKHPPSYDRVFPDRESRAKQMSDDQMYAMVKGLNALFGGEEVD